MEKVEKTKVDNSNRTKCEIWSRVMGYQRPVDFYNIGKKAEFYSRKYFTQKDFNEKYK